MCRNPGAGSTSSQGRVTDTEMAGASVSGEGESFDVDIRTSGRPDEKTRCSASTREPKASAVAYWRSGKGSASSSEPRSGSAKESGATGGAWNVGTGSRETDGSAGTSVERSESVENVSSVAVCAG